jgi:PAS domain S-box-containing protein
MLAVQGANDGIWDWDFETGTAFVSSRWKNMLGYDDDEFRDVVGEWKRLIHPDDYNRALVLLEDYLNGRVSDYQMEYRLRHKDGSYRPILTRGACFRNSGGKPYRMAGSHTDITERKLDEARLNRLNRLYVVLSETGLAILRATNQQAIFQDICRIVVERGRFMLAWIGLADAESGQVAVAASHGNVGYLEAFRISARNGEADSGPTATAIREGKSYISNDYQNDPRTVPWHENAIAHGINSTASTPLWRGGAVIGALTLCAAERDFFDIEMIGLLEQMAGNISFALDSLEIAACRLEAEAALRNETIERLKAVEDLSAHERIMMQQGRHAAMGEMIGNIAHQWRQPLNTLGLIIQQIKFFYEIGEFSGEFLNSSTIKAMDVIRNMSNTIDDFRDFFRSDKEKGLFSINQAIQQAIALIEANFNYHSIGLDVALADNGSINGYANEFSQAVLNIMVNACDVLVEREVAGGQVRVMSQNNDGTLAIIISDNGGGIREEIMEKIFDPYFTTKGPVKGTGIGIYMAKTIIEQNMGGRLTASNGESGAVFRIEVKNDGC